MQYIRNLITINLCFILPRGKFKASRITRLITLAASLFGTAYLAPSAHAIQLSLPLSGSAALHSILRAMGNGASSASVNQTPTQSDSGSAISGSKRNMATPGNMPLTEADTMEGTKGNWTAYLRVSAKPVPSTYPGVSLNILGIKPGMSVQAVRRVLISYYKSQPQATSGTISSSYKNVIFITSQPYTSVLYDSNKSNTDNIWVYFGNQTTGNSVIAIDRKITFTAETGPKLPSVISALDRKYGQRRTFVTPGYVVWHWVFGKAHLINSCPKNGSCPCATDIDPGDSASLYNIDIQGDLKVNGSYGQAQQAMSSGEYACVDAQALPLNSDKNRVSDIEVIVNDPADQVLTLEQAKAQLRATAIAAYKKAVKPEKVPKL